MITKMKRASFLVIASLLCFASGAAGQAAVSFFEQVVVTYGSGGPLSSASMDQGSTLSVIARDSATGAALDIQNRAGVASGDSLAGVAVHNYALGPGLQVDQVGEGGSALVLKQARNGDKMPESQDRVSDASFLSLTRASDDVLPARSIFTIDRFGNLRFDDDSARQESRFIRVVGSYLQFLLPDGKGTIFNQPLQLPQIDTSTAGPFNRAVGITAAGNLAVYNDGAWHEYAPVN